MSDSDPNTQNLLFDRPVGIDLGTTNSEISILDPSERELITYADRFGRKTIPSAVAWNESDESFLVGRAARTKRGDEAHPPVESIKRKMGIAETTRIGPNDMTPEEISAEILKSVAARMATHLQEAAPEDVDVIVKRAVITVPAYFDAPQMEATRKAGELAGLDVLGLLQEPTAAAIYHTFRQKLKDGCFLIYDLGGGTFDVSILRCIGGEYQVLAIDGDNYLGGDDFDRAFASVLQKQLQDRGYALSDLDIREPEDERRLLALRHLAQEIKEGLSTQEVLSINKDKVLMDREGNWVSYEGEIGREEYNAAIQPLVDRSIECCRRALAQSKQEAAVGIEEIDHVVLVGGSTRVPLVIESVKAELCAKSKSEQPLQEEVDTCVALGAAVRAATLGGLRLSTEHAEVQFHSPLVSDSEDYELELTTSKIPEGTREVCISDSEGALASEPPREDKFSFELVLGEEANQPLTLDFFGNGEAAIASIPFSVYRGDLKPRASSLSKPSVVAKDLCVEVVRGGRRKRVVVIGKGKGLPASETHSFATADSSGVVVLRLLQGRLPIKTLALSVPADTPIGTPVNLVVSCDEAMRIEAKAEVLGQELWARVEPQRLEIPSGDAVDALLEQVDELEKSLWGRDAAAFKTYALPMAASLRAALRSDPDRARSLTAQLVQIVAEFRDSSGEGLSPPLHRFERLLDELRGIVYRASGTMLGMDREQWEERIEDLSERAMDAWDGRDATTWRRTYNELQALRETASEEDFANRSGKESEESRTVSRILSLTFALGNLRQQMDEFELSADATVRALQAQEMTRIREGLNEVELKLKSESKDRKTLAREASSAFDRLAKAFERVPQLGVVSERG